MCVNSLAITNIVEEGREVDDAEVEVCLVCRLGVNVSCEPDDALDVVPVVRRVVVAHVLFYVSRHGLDQGVIAEGIHGSSCCGVFGERECARLFGL